MVRTTLRVRDDLVGAEFLLAVRSPVATAVLALITVSPIDLFSDIGPVQGGLVPGHPPYPEADRSPRWRHSFAIGVTSGIVD